MIKLKSLVNSKLSEMPHVEISSGIVMDLKIELYPITKEMKNKYLKAYYEDGVIAYAEKYKKYLFIGRDEVKVIGSEIIDKWKSYIELPSYWELYAEKYI